jgi:hypothetical protein
VALPFYEKTRSSTVQQQKDPNNLWELKRCLEEMPANKREEMAQARRDGNDDRAQQLLREAKDAYFSK